nr:hypothetical protein TetV2_00005 [Oceanusvirus sp.]
MVTQTAGKKAPPKKSASSKKKPAAAKKKSSASKRPLTSYQRFIKACSETAKGETRSGTDMFKWCAKKWNSMSKAEQDKY